VGLHYFLNVARRKTTRVNVRWQVSCKCGVGLLRCCHGRALQGQPTVDASFDTLLRTVIRNRLVIWEVDSVGNDSGSARFDVFSYYGAIANVVTFEHAEVAGHWVCVEE